MDTGLETYKSDSGNDPKTPTGQVASSVCVKTCVPRFLGVLEISPHSTQGSNEYSRGGVSSNQCPSFKNFCKVADHRQICILLGSLVAEIPTFVHSQTNEFTNLTCELHGSEPDTLSVCPLTDVTGTGIGGEGGGEHGPCAVMSRHQILAFKSDLPCAHTLTLSCFSSLLRLYSWLVH